MNTVSQQQVTVHFREPSGKQIRQYFSSTWPPGMIAGTIIISLGTFLLLASILALRFMTVILAIGMILLSVFVIVLGVMLFWQSFKSRVSDEEYDEWLKRQARAIRQEVYYKLQIDRRELTDKVLSIHSFVLPGSTLAERYPEGTVVMKRGRDGKYRFSINFYTFVFPFSRTVAVFTMHFNALTGSSNVYRSDEYTRQHIIAADIDISQETTVIENEQHGYDIYRIGLDISQRSSRPLGACLMAIPAGRGNEAAITLSDTDIYQILGRVRKMLRSY